MGKYQNSTSSSSSSSGSSFAAAGYSLTMMEYPYMKEWTAAAKLEPDELEELDVEF